MSPAAPRILIIDDDITTRLLANEALLRDGFMTSEAEDGGEGLDALASALPDLVLLDVNMPGIDGYEVCRQLRQRPGGASLPVIMMTATDDVASVERAFEAGANDFITKPLKLALLGRRVRFVLRAADAIASARETAGQLARAQRLAGLAHWQVGSDRRFVWSSNPYTVFWPEAGASHAPAMDLMSLVHPDDRARVTATMDLHCSHQIDYRLAFPDGSERHVHQDAELVETEEGKVLFGATLDVTESRRAQLQIAQLAFYDDLTGLPNLSFVERFLQRTASTPRYAVVLDLGAGTFEALPRASRDALMRTAAARLCERVRAGDRMLRLDQAPIAPEDHDGRTMVARIGPYELVVISPRKHELHVANTARQIADAFAMPFPTGVREVTLRPRVGVAEFPEPVHELRHLISRARTALQEAEARPSRDIAVYSDRIRERQHRRAILTRQLAGQVQEAEAGLATELAIDFVPRCSADGTRAIGVRAHAVWHPLVDEPEIFRDLLVEDPALADRIAMWAFSQSCRDLAARTFTDRLAVDISGRQLAVPDFVETFLRMARASGLSLAQIDVEVTPSSCDRVDLERAGAAVQELRAAGVRCVLANVSFQCELHSLLHYRFDGVRVDGRMFDPQSGGFLVNLATVTRALGMTFAVSHVDTPAAAALLDGLTCDEVAGAVIAPAAARAS